jgi:hypothetical protein
VLWNLLRATRHNTLHECPLIDKWTPASTANGRLSPYVHHSRNCKVIAKYAEVLAGRIPFEKEFAVAAPVANRMKFRQRVVVVANGIALSLRDIKV